MAYIAGLYDGDGSFSLCKISPKREGISSLYFSLIQFGNANKEILELIQSMYGGHINTQDAHIAKDGHFRNITHALKLTHAPICRPFLKDISPYLHVKKDRAIFLMDYINNEDLKRKHNKFTSEQIQQRESGYIKMKFYNDNRDMPGKFKIKTARITSRDESFWQYVAGIIDTDGSFSIAKCNQKTSKSIVYNPFILLSMIDPRAIQYIYDNCEYGTLLVIKSKAARQGFLYRYSIHSKKGCAEFINKIVDYLFIKKEAAKMLLEFCTKSCSVKHRRSGIPAEELEFRDSCYRRLVELNKNGVSKLSLIDLKPVTGDADGNKGQAVNNVQPESNKRERLSEEVVCAIPNSVRKTES